MVGLAAGRAPRLPQPGAPGRDADPAGRFAQVQLQNVPLFNKLGWTTLEETSVHGRPHARMQADLAWYPPCHDPVSGFVTRARVAA